MKKITPKNDRVLIRPIDEYEQRHGNIIVPDLGKEKPELGEVISIGPGRLTEFGTWIGVQARVGDIVLVPKVGTFRFEFEGDEYYLTPDREILATITTVTE